MILETAKSVGEIAVELPQAISYFEKKGIDYCCGGNRSLQEACAKAGVPAEEVLKTLQELVAGTGSGVVNPWPTLADLIQYLLDKHHRYTREQLALTTKLGAKVLAVHGNHHPELAEINKLLSEINEELQHHLLKEEQVAFPFLLAFERSQKDGGESGMPFPYEVFKNAPQQVLMGDHEATGQQLAQLRQLTRGYTPPADACISFQAFYRSLADLEADLHKHIHLENNVLFPMAERLAGESVKS